MKENKRMSTVKFMTEGVPGPLLHDRQYLECTVV